MVAAVGPGSRSGLGSWGARGEAHKKKAPELPIGRVLTSKSRRGNWVNFGRYPANRTVKRAIGPNAELSFADGSRKCSTKPAIFAPHLRTAMRTQTFLLARTWRRRKMKTLSGSLLLIFPLIMTGCGTQNPVGGGPNPAPTVQIPDGLNERHAANFLSGAKELQKDGESEQAIEVLNELITLYPKSDVADEARQFLADLKKQSPNAEAAAGEE